MAAMSPVGDLIVPANICFAMKWLLLVPQRGALSLACLGGSKTFSKWNPKVF